MYDNILIDHTLLHSVCTTRNYKNHEEVQIRELIKFIETLLLPDNVYLANIVNKQTFSISESFFEVLHKNNLMNSTSSGIVKLANFPSSKKLEICKASSPKVYEIVRKWDFTKIKQLSEINDQQLHDKYLIRPTGAMALDFVSLSKITFGSDDACLKINDFIEEGGWGVTASMFLINPDLHEWLKKIVYYFPIKDNIAYNTLNTISRWVINETTSDFIRKEQKYNYINYLPAYGRGALLEEQLDRSWFFSPSIIEEIKEFLWDDPAFRTNMSTFVPSKEFPLPIYGLWVLSRCPENSTIDVLLSKILELRESQEVKRFHELFNADNITSDIIKQEVYEELIKEIEYRRKGDSIKLNLKGILKIPIYFMEFRSEVLDRNITSHSLKRFFNRHIKMRGTSTLITKLIENSILTNELQQEIIDKAISILKSIRN